jgi:hypothetical protein
MVITPEMEAALYSAGINIHLVQLLPNRDVKDDEGCTTRDRVFIALVARGIDPVAAVEVAYPEHEADDGPERHAQRLLKRPEIHTAIMDIAAKVIPSDSPLWVARFAVEKLVMVIRTTDNEARVIDACKALISVLGKSLSELVAALPTKRSRRQREQDIRKVIDLAVDRVSLQ